MKNLIIKLLFSEIDRLTIDCLLRDEIFILNKRVEKYKDSPNDFQHHVIRLSKLRGLFM